MRLRFLIPAAALLALAACDSPSRPKTSTVSVPVAANCPPTPAAACPPVAAPAKASTAKAAPAKPAAVRPVARRVHAAPRPAARQYAQAAPHHHHGRFNRYAEGPAPQARDYARVPQPDRDDDAWRQHQAYMEQRERGYARPDEGYGARDRYAHGAYGERRYHEEHAERRYEGPPRAYAPPPPYQHGYAQGGGSYSERSESYSSQSSRGGGYVERGYGDGYSEQGGRRYAEPPCNCAPPQAAGRDRYGFLTWPGKVPARP